MDINLISWPLPVLTAPGFSLSLLSPVKAVATPSVGSIPRPNLCRSAMQSSVVVPERLCVWRGPAAASIFGLPRLLRGKL
jgi:hypothetical protein